jgi:hypothetical protein
MRRMVFCATAVGLCCAACGGGSAGTGSAAGQGSTSAAAAPTSATTGSAPQPSSTTVSTAGADTDGGTPGATQPGVSSPPAACSLVTRADAVAALGGPVPKGDAAGPQACQYSGGGASISVSVRPESASDYDLEQVQQSATRTGSKAIAGIGDAAFLRTYAVAAEDTQASALMTFVKGGAYVSIAVTEPVARKASLGPELTRLGRAAAGRL